MQNHNLISEQEAIRKIKDIFHAGYIPNVENFDAFDQLFICESLAESEQLEQKVLNNTIVDADVKWNGNDTCKQNAIFELTPDKLSVIAKLKEFNYLTPPNNIAILLEILFAEWKSNDGWWLSVAQMWNPRAINRTLDYLVKVTLTGTRTIQNPAAYFTFLIKKRSKRKTI